MRVVERVDWLPVADCAHLIGPIPGDSHDADPKQLEAIPASFWKLLTTLFLTHEYVPLHWCPRMWKLGLWKSFQVLARLIYDYVFARLA
jgi:hypothetical protein